MIRVIWPPEKITALAHVVLTAPLGICLGVVVALAQRGKLIEGRKRSATARDRGAVINHGRGLDFTTLKAGFTQRVLPQFVPAHTLPTLRGIRSN
jgi:hypothetical protein